MNDEERMLESLKLLRESSGWMVGVQTAIFGFLITLLNAGKLSLGSFLIKGSVVAFGLSIVFAGLVLATVPWVLTRKPAPESIQTAPILNLPMVHKMSIGLASGLQYFAFIAGLVCLALAIIYKQIG